MWLNAVVAYQTSCTMAVMVALCLLAVIGSGSRADATLFKVMDSLKVGFRLASTFFNADHHFLSSVLGRLGGLETGKRRSGAEAAVPFFMKLMGLNSTKVEDLAFDGFVFLTHLISQTLIKNSNGEMRQEKWSLSEPLDFSPFQYMIQQPQVLGLLTQMEDPNLVEVILKESKRKLMGYAEEDVQCIPLLVCKMNPFVRGMQRSLRFFIKKTDKSNTDACYLNATEECQERTEWEKSGFEDRMFFFVPSLEEVIRHGDICDDRFPKCVY